MADSRSKLAKDPERRPPDCSGWQLDALFQQATPEEAFVCLEQEVRSRGERLQSDGVVVEFCVNLGVLQARDLFNEPGNRLRGRFENPEKRFGQVPAGR